MRQRHEVRTYTNFVCVRRGNPEPVAAHGAAIRETPNPHPARLPGQEKTAIATAC